ncbi:MAG: AAA family ATPase [Candidatus Bathyarchaeota archaeon]|nr:AAA family ATPase [Candidatus Bathyarchaeota archaeon]
MKDKIVVGVTGMPGAGKGVIRKIVRRMGYHVVVMGDEIREEAKRRNLKPTPENLGMIMLKLREEQGPAAVAKRCITKMERIENKVIVVEGIRSPQEVNEFRGCFPNFTLVAVQALPKTRFRRLFQRKRSDDPKSWEKFMERDLREVEVGVELAIASADHLIVNEGTKSQMKRRTREVLQEVLGKWMK